MTAVRVRLAVAGLAVAAAACGSGRDAEPERPLVTSDIAGQETRRCQYTSPPDQLPSFDALTRSGTRGNLALWGSDMAAEDTVQLSVRYDDEGRLEWVQPIRTTLPEERTAALERLVLGALEETGTRDWGVRILVVGGDLEAVEPSVICPPQRSRQPQRLVGFPVTPEGRYALYQARGLRFPVRITLDEQGRIMDVRLGRRTGQTEADQFLMDYVRSQRYEPKTHDGIAIAAVVEDLITLPRRSR